MISHFSLKGSDNLIVSLLRKIFLSWETTHPGTNLIAHLSNFQYPSCQPHLTISLFFSVHIGVQISPESYYFFLRYLKFAGSAQFLMTILTVSGFLFNTSSIQDSEAIQRKPVHQQKASSKSFAHDHIWSFNCKFTFDSVREYGLFQNILTALSSWISIGSVLLSSRQAPEWHLN